MSLSKPKRVFYYMWFNLLLLTLVSFELNAAEPLGLLKFECMPELEMIEVHEFTMEYTPYESLYKNHKLNREVLKKYNYYTWPIENATCHMDDVEYSLRFNPVTAAYDFYTEEKLLISGMFSEANHGYEISKYIIETDRNGKFERLILLNKIEPQFISKQNNANCFPVILRKTDNRNKSDKNCLDD